MSDSIDAPPLALTQLSDDERLFATASTSSRDREVRPLVREMDEHAAMSPALLDEAVRARRHGHRDSRDSTAAPARTFFHSVLAVEALSRVDPSVGVLVDVQNTLVINAVRALGHRRAEAPLSAALAARARRRLRLSEAGSGSDAFALTTRAVEDGDGSV